MAQYDGSIRINTKIDSKEASAQLMTLENRIVKTADKVAALRSKMDFLKNVQIPTQEYQEIQKQITETEKKLASLSERREKFLATGGKESSSVFKKMEYDAEQLNKTLEYSQGELQDLVNTGKAFTFGSESQEYANLGQQLRYAESDLSVLNQRHEELISKSNETKSSYVSLGESVKNAFRIMGKSLIDIPIKTVKAGVNKLISGFKKLGNVALNVAKGPFKMLGSIAKGAFSRITKSTSGANKSFGLSLKNILKYGFGIRSLYALFNKLRSAIKEGYQNLYNDNERFKNSVDSLKASATTLKNSLAAAFRPLVDIAIPYIQKVMDYMSGLLDSVGQFLAAITGQKMYTKAIKQTTAALKEEKKAAEGYLSPLDEINKYRTNKDSGSEAGTGGTMFEELPISDKFKDLAQWFKDMWVNADFTELGTLIGQKLKNALDSIPWDQIQETARKIGSSIATLINGFVEVDGLGYSIGNTLAQAVNTGFNFLNEFVHKLHWDSIGKFLADSLNGIFQNIDWPLIYDTFVTGAKGLGDSINSFVDELDWNSIANSVSNLVNTFVDTVYTFITTVDWKKLGEKVGKTISDAWNGIDWAKSGETLGEAFKAFFDFISKAIQNVDWRAVGESVKEFLLGIDWAGVVASLFELIGSLLGGIGAFIVGIIGDSFSSSVLSSYFAEKINEAGGNIVEGIYNGIVEGLKNIGNWIKENILDPFIEGFKNAFGIHSPSTVMAEMGKYLMEGLLVGIKSLVDTVVQSVKDVWDGIKKTFEGFMQFFKGAFTGDWKSAWSGIVNIFKGIYSTIKGIVDGIISVIRGIIDGVRSAISAIDILTRKKSSLSSGAGNRFMSAGSSYNKYTRSGPSMTYASPAFEALANTPIPRLATGAVIPANREFLAVLGEQKHGTNVEAPLDTIRQASEEAVLNVLSKLGVMSGGNSAGTPVNLTLQVALDGQVLGQKMIDWGKLQQMATGSNPYGLGTT